MGFTGKKLDYQYHFPVRGEPWDNLIKVGGADPIDGLPVDGVVLYQMSFTDSAIFFDFTATALWALEYEKEGKVTPVTFNGPVFKDVEGTIPAIIGIKLSTNISEIVASDVSFDSDTIAIDFKGAGTTDMSYLGISVIFQPTSGAPMIYRAEGGSVSLAGQGGDDKLYGARGADILKGGRGDDTLSGGGGDDVLQGGKGNDLIHGGWGRDIIRGGEGADDLYGDGGADRFVFASLSEMGRTRSGADTIFDFTRNDRIDLRLIDADTSKDGNQKFAFVGTDAFSGLAGELRYDRYKSDTFISGDVDGDGKADFVIHLDDAVTMEKDFFLL